MNNYTYIFRSKPLYAQPQSVSMAKTNRTVEVNEDELIEAQLEGFLREFIEDGLLTLVDKDGEDTYELTEKALKMRSKK